ncbi:hypothetical protein [Actinoplanes sp. URMC 104]|uniref:hypothetical protein n=1 Tax=Actinoplanes sp. URMC 104 TaxID=3423409 RepID=UPI003F1A9684
MDYKLTVLTHGGWNETSGEHPEGLLAAADFLTCLASHDPDTAFTLTAGHGRDFTATYRDVTSVHLEVAL